MRGASLARILLAGCCCVLLSAHPVTTYRARLRLADGATMLRITFTYDDVLTHHLVQAGDAGYPPAELAAAIAAHAERLRGALRLYAADGRPLPLRNWTLTGATMPATPVPDSERYAHACVLTLEFAPTAPGAAQVLFDLGGWRLGVSCAVVCAVPGEDGEVPVLWRERERYLLLPPDGAPALADGTRLVPPREKMLTGFSYCYVEADHVRHELILPLLAAVDLLEPPPPGNAVLDAADRNRLRTALLAQLAGSEHLRVDGTPTDDEEPVLRWFTRSSLAAGVVSDAAELPVATGFVGVIVRKPTPRPARGIILDSSPWQRLVTDQVVAVFSDDGCTRAVADAVEPVVRWSGRARAAPTAGPPVPATPGAGPRPRGLALLAVAAAAALLALRFRHRGAVLLAAGALAVAGGVLCFRPRPARDRAGAEAILAPLVAGVYRACERADERDALADLGQVSADPLRTRLYLELRAQLAGPWAARGGTTIERVDLTDCRPARDGPGDLAARCAWRIAARIEHWGHVHRRVLAVEAALRAGVVDGRWRLHELRLLDKRVESTSSRSVRSAGGKP